MRDPAATSALLRLLAWLSPAFPVGSFAYSHGVERAVHDGLVTDDEALSAWLATLVETGSGWNDAVLLAEAWRLAQSGGDAACVAELAEALAGSHERHAESMQMGSAFLAAAAAWRHPAPMNLPPPCAYCVAVGATAGAHGIALEDALAAYLHAFFSNLVQAAIRLGVLGQKQAADALARFEPLAVATARRAAVSTLDDLGGCAFVADVAAMKHETQHSRLFRS